MLYYISCLIPMLLSSASAVSVKYCASHCWILLWGEGEHLFSTIIPVFRSKCCYAELAPSRGRGGGGFSLLKGQCHDIFAQWMWVWILFPEEKQETEEKRGQQIRDTRQIVSLEGTVVWMAIYKLVLILTALGLLFFNRIFLSNTLSWQCVLLSFLFSKKVCARGGGRGCALQ